MKKNRKYYFTERICCEHVE